MSSEPPPSPSPKPPTTSSPFSALEYTGLPKSWFTKRPKLPSRNWLIFIGVVSSITYLYVDDRRKCKSIREEYVNKVKHLSEDTLETWDSARKVTVYSCRWPGDDDYERSRTYFKKYVKPVLVSAAVDFEIVNGNHHGSLAESICNKIKARRRSDLGIDESAQLSIPLPLRQLTPEQKRQKELEGGTIIIGRHTFKEYMAGLKRGWSESLVKVDREEELAKALQDDGEFDEPESELAPEEDTNTEPSTSSQTLSPPFKPVFSPLQQLRAPIQKFPSSSSSSHPQPSSIPSHLDIPPPTINLQPPLLLVPFRVLLGFRNIPLIIMDFFNERRKVREGAEAAYQAIFAQTREFRGPQSTPADLDFDLPAEEFFSRDFQNLPTTIEKARKSYNEELQKKLKLARDLARSVREPTKDEIKYPPPTEVELKAERLKKEMKWRDDLVGWEILRAGKPVEWDERFEQALKVFDEPFVGMMEVRRDS